MKCMCADDSGQALIEKEIPQPAPQAGEVLIRVRAAGVTSSELDWYPSSHTKEGGSRAAAVPSHEFSGEIAGFGEGVKDLSIGQEVYGMNDWFADGALAEFCITKPAWIAPKPRSLSHGEAASLPISALTARQGLLDRAHLRAGERVLIHGGAGAVGTLAVQFAHRDGAHVIATVSARDIEFVKGLGADEAIDYKASPFEKTARDIDVVFDAVGGETLQRSWSVLKKNGRLVTIASDAESSPADDRVKNAFFIVEPNRQQLIEVAELIDQGSLRPVVDTILPFSQAPLAYAGKVAKKGRGKLVVALIAST
jgi:NADPH:quinone reductase-like Zn-dependent oxidoreductase